MVFIRLGFLVRRGPVPPTLRLFSLKRDLPFKQYLTAKKVIRFVRHTFAIDSIAQTKLVIRVFDSCPNGLAFCCCWHSQRGQFYCKRGKSWRSKNNIYDANTVTLRTRVFSYCSHIYIPNLYCGHLISINSNCIGIHRILNLSSISFIASIHNQQVTQNIIITS